MKRILLYCIVVLFAGVPTACSDWLNVSSELEKNQEEIFSDDDGFQSVLIGAYIRMKQTSLYGMEMVCGTVEMLAQHWNNSTKGSLNYDLSLYDYRASSVESAVGSIYNNLYKVIADVNGLLEYIDRQQSIFSKDHYELIKGEALAIRAFCHFDVLRLFGPMPMKLPHDAILPYVLEVKNTPNSKLTWQEFTKYLLNDLKESEDYLKAVDPICMYSLSDLTGTSVVKDDFLRYRQLRMNYYAICALKARVLLWIGDTNEALKYAMIVINAKDSAGNPMYRLGNSDDCSRLDYTFSTEHIFSLNVNDLSATLGSGSTYEKDKTLLTSRLYDAGTTDIRFLRMWEEVAGNWWEPKHNYFTKYVQSEKTPSLAKNMIPMIRLYEMYLVAMECSTLSEATELYKTMCIARDISPVNINSSDQLEEILIKEYNKEFYGEGQMFYTYKRLAVEDILYAKVPGSVETYIIPLPKEETI